MKVLTRRDAEGIKYHSKAEFDSRTFVDRVIDSYNTLVFRIQIKLTKWNLKRRIGQRSKYEVN